MNTRLKSYLVAAFFCAPSIVLAATYHVAPNGSSSNAGTVSSPWSVDKAVAEAGPGDVVLFADGLYADQSICLRKSGTVGSPIVFRAAEGAVPVFRGRDGNGSDGFTSCTVVHHIVVEGLWFENWRYGGIGFSWNYRGASNIEVRYVVADNNQKNGINMLFTNDVLVEHSIASRNGWGPDSWSSNFNIFGVTGTNNVIRGNVAFHGVDTSGHQTDGNGYILDISIDKGTALFESNIGFSNGGACISITDSRGASVVNNSCYHNAKSIDVGEISFTDTCRDAPSGIPVNGGHYSLIDVLLRNNVAIAEPGRRPLGLWACGDSTNWVNSTVDSNLFESSDGNSVYANPSIRDFHPESDLIDAGTVTTLAAADNGFDPRCLKLEGGQRYSWWTHAPDLEYMRSIGGIKNCFAPVKRTQGSAPDLGAYETGGVVDLIKPMPPVLSSLD